MRESFQLPEIWWWLHVIGLMLKLSAYVRFFGYNIRLIWLKKTEIDLKPMDINNGDDSDSDNENKKARLLYNSDR
jgi:hypothetical protein